MPLRHCDVLILGQGLAGSALAWRLAACGVEALVVDRGHADDHGRPSASRVAAGLITPVTGKRLTVAEHFDQLMLDAKAFYRHVAREIGVDVLQERPALRLFIDGSERSLFHERAARLGDSARLAFAEEIPAGLEAPHGGFVMPGAARLNVRSFLDATADWLAGEGRLHRLNLDVQRDLRFTEDRIVVEPLRVATRRLILCQGHTAAPCAWLHGVRFVPAKGEVLTVELPTLATRQVIHRGVWIAPDESAAAGRYRVGSTTSWDDLTSEPTAAGREELLGKLHEAGVADACVVGHSAAVRPSTHNREPAWGFSPTEPRIGWLNGLGAKGSLWAPTCALRMAETVAESLRQQGSNRGPHSL